MFPKVVETPRIDPWKLSTWNDLQKCDIGGGYESKGNPLTTTTQTHTMHTHRTTLDIQQTLPTHWTPLYGQVTKRRTYRISWYWNEAVTNNPFDW